MRISQIYYKKNNKKKILGVMIHYIMRFLFEKQILKHRIYKCMIHHYLCISSLLTL